MSKGVIGKRLPMMKKGVSCETYIDELNRLQNKKIVCIDPGLQENTVINILKKEHGTV